MNTSTLEMPSTAKRGGVRPGVETSGRNVANLSRTKKLGIPYTIGRWLSLHTAQQELLNWFHTRILDEDLNVVDAAALIDYSHDVLRRVLKDEYPGSYAKVCKAIKNYRDLVQEREDLKSETFVETRETRMITSALKYALSNGSITLIQGASRQSKTMTTRRFASERGSARCVMIDCPVIGGPSALLSELSHGIGVYTGHKNADKERAIYSAFNKDRLLAVDEAHFSLPDSPTATPRMLELLRRIRDKTGCGLALLTTARWNDRVKASNYQYEQILGRIGLAIRLPKQTTKNDIMKIVGQFMKAPSAKVQETAFQIGNSMGRLGLLVETLKLGVKLASANGSRMQEKFFMQALAMKQQIGS